MRPNESVASRSSGACSWVFCQAGYTYHLATIVRALPKTDSSSQIAEVPHLAVLPQKWILRRNSARFIGSETGIRYTDHGSWSLIIATGPRDSVWPAQSPNILKSTLFPQKRSDLHSNPKKRKGIGNVAVRNSHGLTCIVDGDTDAVAAARNYAEVDDSPPYPERGAILRESSRVKDSGLRCAETPSSIVN